MQKTARALHRALREVFGALGDRATRPVDLTRSLGMHQGLAGKLHRAVRKHDPLAAAQAMPGPEALQIFLRALDGAEIPEETIETCSRAVGDWDHLIAALGGRTALDAILAAWLPEARQRFEIGNRQRAFKAMSALKGVVADTSVSCIMLHPGSKEGQMDLVGIEVHIGVRRLIPGARIQFGFGIVGGPQEIPVENLEGERVGPTGPSVLVDALSSQVRFRTEVDRPGESVYYVLDDEDFGCAESADLYFAFVIPDLVPTLPLPGKDRTATSGSSIFIPVQYQLMDMFVHKDVFPGAQGEALGFDLVHRGDVHPKDLTPDIRMDVLEQVQLMTNCPVSMGHELVPSYPDLVRKICDARGWSCDDFRVFRLGVQYPLYGHKYLLSLFTP